jgi:NADH-quinone oxidoreductase subunit M
LVAFTLLGAQGVLTLSALQGLSTLDPLVALLLLFGFGVKLPVWPCYSWLLRAHVEASVEFSILLSGVVVKFGALGLARVLEAQPAGPAASMLVASCLLGMVEATLRLSAQRDLKRIVALTTVVEMNWVGLCLGLGGVACLQTAGFLLVAHSFATTAEFYLTEVIYKRYHSRDVTQLSGLYAQTPLLWVFTLATTLTSLGFPATSLFAAKLAFLATLSSAPWALFVPLLVGLMLALPLVFVRLWAPL